MTDNTVTKGSMLIGIQTMTGKFMTSHTTNGVDEIVMVKVFKPVLIWIMGVGLTIEVQSRRVFDPILIMSIL